MSSVCLVCLIDCRSIQLFITLQALADMSKLEFHIVEIPEGQSRQVLTLDEDDLDLSPYTFKGGEIEIEFYRTLHFIRVNFVINLGIKIQCDRSLDYFVKPVDADYEVLFKVDVKEETEDENGAVRRFNFSSNTLSIEEEVRDTIMLQIPIKKLHPRFLDEQGNPKEYESQTYGSTSRESEEENIDPRWEDLKKLKN